MRSRTFRLRRPVFVAGASGVLLGVALAWAVWSGAYGSRPRPGRLLGLDITTGAERFNVTAQTASVYLSTVSNGLVVVTGADECGVPAHHEETYAYSLPSGVLRWHRRSPGACVADTAPHGNSQAYPAKTGLGVTITGAPPGPASNTATYTARDRRTGRVLWRKLRRSTADDRTGQLQAIGDGLAFFVQPETGTLEAFALKTGALRWSWHLADWQIGGFSQVVASAGAVAVVGQSAVLVLDARRGSKRWARLLSTAGTYARAPAAIHDGLILIPSISSEFGPVDE